MSDEWTSQLDTYMEEMMTHRHEWKEQYITKRHVDILQFKCDCGERMMPEEIGRRLNATECFPRIQAMLLGGVLRVEFGVDRASGFCDLLAAYAMALDGSDE